MTEPEKAKMKVMLDVLQQVRLESFEGETNDDVVVAWSTACIVEATTCLNAIQPGFAKKILKQHAE